MPDFNGRFDAAVAREVARILRDTSCNHKTRMKIAADICVSIMSAEGAFMPEHIFIECETERGERYFVESPQTYGLAQACHDIIRGEFDRVRRILSVEDGRARDITKTIALLLCRLRGLSPEAQAFVDWCGYECVWDL